MAAVHKLFPDKSFPSETTLDITPLRTLEWQNIMAMCSYIYEIEESCEEAEQAAYTLEQLGQHRERMRISLVEDKMDYKDWLYL